MYFKNIFSAKKTHYSDEKTKKTGYQQLSQ